MNYKSGFNLSLSHSRHPTRRRLHLTFSPSLAQAISLRQSSHYSEDGLDRVYPIFMGVLYPLSLSLSLSLFAQHASLCLARSLSRAVSFPFSQGISAIALRFAVGRQLRELCTNRPPSAP